MHAASPGVWLVRHKQDTGVASMTYDDLVREALCFGWVDSLVKRLDDERYSIKVMPASRPASGRTVTCDVGTSSILWPALPSRPRRPTDGQRLRAAAGESRSSRPTSRRRSRRTESLGILS